MTTFDMDVRLTACALDELEPDERRELERALAADPSARSELAEIARVVAVIEHELTGPTGLALSPHQRFQLEGVWRGRSAGVSEPGAPGESSVETLSWRSGQLPFDDFVNASRRHDRRRLARSLLAAALLYGALAAALVELSSREVNPRLEEQVRMDFVPPAGARYPSTPRARMKRAEELAPSRAAAAGTADTLVQPAPFGGAPMYRVAYPRSARLRGIQGEVVVRFVVREDGSVSDVEIMSGPEAFRASVLKAVAKWRFRPAHRGSQALRFVMTKVIRFELEDG